MDLSLKVFLAERKVAVCKAWLDEALAIYSDEYAKFIRESPDPFANPVGAIFKEGLESLFEALLDGADTERCRAALARVVRIRAVQDVPPSQALAFVPLLKSVVRQILHEQMQDEKTREAMSAFEAQIDRLALLAFDLYMECREKIFEIRINEIKRNTARLLERATTSSEKVTQLQGRGTCQPPEGRCP